MNDKQRVIPLGDVVAAVFDEAADHGIDETDTTRLAVEAIAQLLRDVAPPAPHGDRLGPLRDLGRTRRRFRVSGLPP